MSIKLCSLTDLKDFVEQSATSTFDSTLELILKLVSGQFETYTGRKFALASKTEYRDAGHKFYFVDTYPIIDGSVTITYNNEVQVEDEDYYVWYEDGYFEFYDTPVKEKPKQIKLEWSGGYPTDDDGVITVDDSITYACLLQCSFIFRRRRDIGITKVTLPDGAVGGMKTAELLPDVKSILNSYKKIAH